MALLFFRMATQWHAREQNHWVEGGKVWKLVSYFSGLLWRLRHSDKVILQHENYILLIYVSMIMIIVKYWNPCQHMPAFYTLTRANKCTHTILCQWQYLNINIYHYLPRLIHCDYESLLLFGMKAFLEFNTCFDLLDVVGNLSLVILAARCQDPSLYCWFHISFP